MAIMLLEEAERRIRAAVERGDADEAIRIFHRVVGERTHVMHERAQAAEGKHARAERTLARLSEFVGGMR